MKQPTTTPTGIPTTLAGRIRHQRQLLGLTQTQLARNTRVSQQLVNRLENGKVSSTKRILALAAALQVSPEWLVGTRHTPQRSTPERPKTSPTGGAADAVRKILLEDLAPLREDLGVKRQALEQVLVLIVGWLCEVGPVAAASLHKTLLENARKTGAPPGALLHRMEREAARVLQAKEEAAKHA